MAGGWKLSNKNHENCTIRVAKTKVLISFAVYCKADLRLFFSHIQICWFSHDVAKNCCLHCGEFRRVKQIYVSLDVVCIAVSIAVKYM